MIEDNNFPLISVIIIGKNEKDTIEKCILSIFNQSYPNFEIIYVDDKSTNNTLEKAQRLKNILDSKKIARDTLSFQWKQIFPAKIEIFLNNLSPFRSIIEPMTTA